MDDEELEGKNLNKTLYKKKIQTVVTKKRIKIKTLADLSVKCRVT